jgi:hypothetical protein
VNFSHQLLQKKKQESRMSRLGEIMDEESASGVKMMRGLLVVELFSKSCFVNVVAALRQKKMQGSRISRVGEIQDVDSKSSVRMIKGLLVVELFLKGWFVDVVVTCGHQVVAEVVSAELWWEVLSNRFRLFVNNQPGASPESGRGGRAGGPGCTGAV